MNYVSFYRKWRPQDFDQVIGQDYNIQTLKNALTRKKLSHSYIFCGPRGTGKTSTARILAKALNCKEGITPNPCNKCSNCISISNGSSVDVIEIDAASNRGINEIRELREKVKYLPGVMRKKVYIIDEVHMLTTEAFNALLKVLEEPPEHVTFIMATTEPNKVLPTIMSRCQRFDFYPISQEQIRKRLEAIAKEEKIKVSKEALSQIARYSDGSLRDADGILEQLAAYSGDRVEASDVASLLGLVDTELLFELTEIISGKDLDGGIAFVKKVLSTSQNLRVFVSEFLDHLYNLYVVKNYKNPGQIVETGSDYLELYAGQAEKIQKEEIEFYLEIFTDLLKQIRWGENAKIFFKSAVIRAVNFIVLDEDKLNRKITTLEARIRNLEDVIKKIKPVAGSAENAAADGIKSTTVLQKSNASVRKSALNQKIAEVDLVKDRVIAAPQKENEKEEISDEDFDIINSGALEETENIRRSKKPGKKAEESANIDLIYDNLEKITELLKIKKISVQAMFIEAEPDRIESGVAYFTLDHSRKWHKDHLSKKGNLSLISEVIREVTGKKFQVCFELGGINHKNQIKYNKSQEEIGEGEVDFITGPPVMENEKDLPGKVPEEQASGEDKAPYNQLHEKMPEKEKAGSKNQGEKAAGERQFRKNNNSGEKSGEKDSGTGKVAEKNKPSEKKPHPQSSNGENGSLEKDEETGKDILKYFEKKFNIKEKN